MSVFAVAPCVGARIEIYNDCEYIRELYVAPCIGARIEILPWVKITLERRVALCEGERIEIDISYIKEDQHS